MLKIRGNGGSENGSYTKWRGVVAFCLQPCDRGMSMIVLMVIVTYARALLVAVTTALYELTVGYSWLTLNPYFPQAGFLSSVGFWVKLMIFVPSAFII